MPKSLVSRVVFDQSVYVKTAIKNLGNEGLIGLVLTALMILIFLGNFRATLAVMLSIPLSALAAFLAINMTGGTINTMVLGGLALVFSRLIDNSVVVLENIFRHLEEGETPEVAAENGGQEVALAGAGGDLYHGHRVLSGGVPLWREPLPVHGLGGGGGVLAVRVLPGGDDGGAVVLRPLPQGPRVGCASRDEKLVHAFRHLVQPQVRPDADALRHRGRQDAAASGGDRGGHPRAFAFSALRSTRCSASRSFRAPIPANS